MDQKRTSLSVFFPLFMALMLAAGLVIGYGLRGGGQQMPGFLATREPAAADKIGEVIDLLDRQYVDTVRTDHLVDEVIEDLLQRLDPHSYYITSTELRAAQEPLEGSFEGIGVEFTIQRDTVIVIAPVEGGPSEKLGVRAGDRFISADGKPLAGVGITNQDVMDRLRGPGGSKVIVSILRKGKKKPFDVEIERGKIPINSVAASLMTPDKVGYIKLVRFARTTHAEFVDAAKELLDKGMKELVIDLRGNGGGFLDQAIEMADELLPAGRMIVYTEGRMHPRKDELATKGGLLETIPLAILIDEGSASASEILAGAVQDNDRGIVVGRRSFGKGLVQEHIMLPDSSAVRITTARYYTPSGRSIQRPYGEGIDYEGDFESRFEHGELLSADSIQLDSAKAYTTVGGRAVFGGGGIMPDVFVPADTADGSEYLSQLFYTGTLNQFTFDVADRDRSQLENYRDADEYISRYVVSSALLDELATYAEKQGIKPDPSALSRSRKPIASRVKAGIARNLWGAQGYYSILLETDSIFLKAQRELEKR